MVAKSKFWCLVIEKLDTINNKEITDIDLLKYLKENQAISYYACILHDKDVDDEGVLKRKHYHLVIKLDTVRSGKSIAKDIAKSLMINDFCISYSVCRSLVKSVQYLVHQNDIDKFQYSEFDIYSNDINETMNIIINNESMEDLDIDILIDLIRCSSKLSQVYRTLGLSKSRQYRSLITDLWKEKINNEI